MSRALVVAVLLWFGGACRAEQAPTRPSAPSAPAARSPAPAPRAKAPTDDFTPPDADGWGRAGSLRTLEVVRGGADPGDALPLVIVIHGLGDRAHAHWLHGLDAPVRLVMPQAPTPYHGGFAWFPYRSAGSTPAQLADGIAAAAEQLADTIAIVARERPTRGKPIVTGFSQGGMLSFALALAHADRLSLALPVSGLLPRPLWPEARDGAVRHPPIRALHGDADTLVPTQNALDLVDHLKQLGFDAELGVHRGVAHTITPQMNVELVANVLAGIAKAPAVARPSPRPSP